MEQKLNSENLLKRINHKATVLEDTHWNPISKNGENKGRLKIFLGFCAGVGKTYRMLEEARSAKVHKVDVVIAVAESHGRKETEALLEGLEIIPKKKFDYQGVTIEEIDLDRILERRPQLVIVDELAHSNFDGMKHSKRYQDIEELLDAGIDVYTTLNIQHIESTLDIVYQITKIKVRETVPDRILEMADEIELVDLSPEKLLERLREGKVYVPEQIRVALLKFFNLGNLLALRELSLRYTAKQVDKDILSYKESHDILAPWPLGSRVLVAISPSSTSENLLRFSHRMAMSFDAELYAVSVESPQLVNMNDAAQDQLNFNMRLAEELGAKVYSLSGYNIADEILKFAKQKDISLIIAGLSRRSKLEEILKGSILKDLIKKSGTINVLILGNEDFREEESIRPILPKTKGLFPYLLSLLCILVMVGISWIMQYWTTSMAVSGMLLLIPPMVSSVLWGIRVGIFASLFSAAALNFFFIPPVLSFKVTNLDYLPIFIVFLIVSLIIGYLAKIIKWQADSARRREHFLSSLNSFNREMMLCEALEEILERAVKYITEAFESHVIIFLPDQNSNLEIRTKLQIDFTFNENEKSAATWVYQNALPAGKDTTTLSALKWHYHPLRINNRTIGVIAVTPITDHIQLTPEQNRLFESFANSVALALHRMG